MKDNKYFPQKLLNTRSNSAKIGSRTTYHIRINENVVTWPAACTLLRTFCIGGAADRLLVPGSAVRRHRRPVVRHKARVHGRHVSNSLLYYKLILGLKTIVMRCFVLNLARHRTGTRPSRSGIACRLCLLVLVFVHIRTAPCPSSAPRPSGMPMHRRQLCLEWVLYTDVVVVYIARRVVTMCTTCSDVKNLDFAPRLLLLGSFAHLIKLCLVR